MKWTLYLTIIFAMEWLDQVPSAAAVIVPGDFIDNLFQKYGTNGSMSSAKFSSLLQALGVGRDNGNSSIPGSVDNTCFSGGKLMNIFSLNASNVVKNDFRTVCPAIVQQIDSKSCEEKDMDQPKENQKESKSKAWGYGILSVAIISLASLFGAFIVPFMSKGFFKKLLLFMVSLAVGVLSGSSIFHLLPKTLGVHVDKKGRIFKCAVVVVGIYFFFLLEYAMKLYIRYKEEKQGCAEHSHYRPDASINTDEIAQAQLGLYKVNTDPNHHHTAGGLIISNDISLNPDPDAKSTSVVDVKMAPENKEVEKRHVAPVAWMIVIGDGVHNFIDGLAIGAAYSTAAIDGLSTSLAIFCEELPHELGDFAVLLSSGMSYKLALGFNFLSACACFLGLIIGLLLGYTTTAVKWIYGLAAGMFLYISLVDMLQEATEMSFREGEGSLRKSLKMFSLQSFGMLLGFAIMFILGMYHDKIKL